MSRFRIDHPTRPGAYAEYGHDHMLGFYAECFIDQRSKPTAVLDFFKLGRTVTLQDCFEFLIAEGLIDRADLETALTAMQDSTRVRSRNVRRIVEIVGAFKSAAD